MPPIDRDDVTVALDMYGCPNRCRHCWLGCEANPSLGWCDLRWVAKAFRGHRDLDAHDPYFRRLKVMSWFREPDYADDYRELNRLEAELSDGEPRRFELLSIWRLANDETYAHWAREIGTKVCQVSFFGLGRTQDWFHRRAGAFDDSLLATERLLEAGIIPRWQLFLTRRIIPELGELMRLVERLKLQERVEALGGEFTSFCTRQVLTARHAESSTSGQL